MNSLSTIRLWKRQEPMTLFLHARDHEASHLYLLGSFCGLVRFPPYNKERPNLDL